MRSASLGRVLLGAAAFGATSALTGLMVTSIGVFGARHGANSPNLRRARELVRVRWVRAWVDREVGGLTNQVLAKELHQGSAVLGRGLGKVAEELERNPALYGLRGSALR